ncbi:TetR/AcrR family transcriptional regulator [Catellatospora tritici]|uniref:TetR/AcrR family transcriptional regulator n=1 Tax=Catellatospora tritici TaxID=2851566 RepID=UPI001C2CDF41|nr:TetR/AcrR family transcriptional regulator [Catellatospora tritici]MBV1854609.1 TetR/AcrR family transcriptional regulator [Catellatospora tritici]
MTADAVSRSGVTHRRPINKTRRDIITESAYRVFLRNGYAATTITDIAAEAGVAKPTVYNYFDSKDAVFAEAIQHAVQQAVPRLVTAIGPVSTSVCGAHVADALACLAERLVDVYCDESTTKLRRLMIVEIDRLPPGMAGISDIVTYPCIGTVTQKLAELQQLGHLQLDDSRQAADLLLALALQKFPQLALIGQSADSASLATYIRAGVDCFLGRFRIPDRQVMPNHPYLKTESCPGVSLWRAHNHH